MNHFKTCNNNGISIVVLIYREKMYKVNSGSEFFPLPSFKR